MAFVKKHLVNLIFGVIALVAIIATFFPLGGYFSKLDADVQARKAKYEEAKKLLETPHELPNANITETEQHVPLGVFPMPRLTEMAEKYMGKLESQSRDVFKAALALNQAECAVGPRKQMLLVPESLPTPKGNADRDFQKAVAPEAEYKYLREKVLGGGYPPTGDDITKAGNALLAEHQKKLIKGVDGQAINEAEVQAAFQAEADKLPEKMRTEAAAKSRMYVAPDAMLTPPELALTVARAPTPEQIWFAQAALWVQEDVCRALAECNAKATNVMDAPVKHLMKLDVPFGPAIYTRPAGAADAGGGDPNAPAPPVVGADASGAAGAATGGPNNEPPKPNFTLSPTGRACNRLYDVANFTLILRVDQTKLPLILQQLQSNRLIAVKRVSALRVDTAKAKEAGFVYGTAPVAEVVIEGEQLQMREWTIDFMPKTIKDTVLVGPVEYQKELAPKKPAEPTAQATP